MQHTVLCSSCPTRAFPPFFPALVFALKCFLVGTLLPFKSKGTNLYYMLTGFAAFAQVQIR